MFTIEILQLFNMTDNHGFQNFFKQNKIVIPENVYEYEVCKFYY